MPEPTETNLVGAGFTSESVVEAVQANDWSFLEASEPEEPEVVDNRLRETGNGPTISYEEALLLEYFGEPDEEGVYR